MHPLEMQRITKSYPSGWRRTPVAVLRGIDLTLAAGECFGFLGANGAGKTTTLKILVGLLRPTGGEARLWGVPVWQAESRRRVGFLPEEPSLPLRLSPREFLDYGGRLAGVPARERRRRAEELIERLGLTSFAGAPLRRLSKGQRQRAALAQSLVGDPDLLLLDEPLTGLDAPGRRDVIDLLGELRTRGTTIFFSSHVLPDVERLCDRVGVLGQGLLLAVGSPRAVAAEQGLPGASLEDVFLQIVCGDRQGTPERSSPAPRREAETPRELVGV